MSAAGSTDTSEPISGYDWDFNGDGIYDRNTTSPLASHTCSAAFDGNVVVRVRSKSGLTALASAPLVVSAPVGAAPAEPTSLHGTPSDAQATVTWAAAPGPLARWFTIYNGAGTMLDRIAAQPDGSAPIGWVATALTNGTVYSFKISAGNENGESAAAGPIVVTPRPKGSPPTISGTPPVATVEQAYTFPFHLAGNPVPLQRSQMEASQRACICPATGYFRAHRRRPAPTASQSPQPTASSPTSAIQRQ